MSADVPLPRPDYADVHAWLYDDEREILAAFCNPDVLVEIDVSVKLHEYRGKRLPRRLTPEQQARVDAASRHIGPRLRGYQSVRGLLCMVANGRRDTAHALGVAIKEGPHGKD